MEDEDGEQYGVDKMDTESVKDAINDAASEVEQAIDNATGRIEKAIAEQWSFLQWLGVGFVVFLLWSWVGDIWHSKWRYAQTYNVSEEEVNVEKKPHDCDFFAAPLGDKYCHYERTVLTARWATSTEGQPIISYDDGKTWSTFDPAGQTVPQSSTLKKVYIEWEKKED